MFLRLIPEESDNENENRFSFRKNLVADCFFQTFSCLFDKKISFRFPIPASRLSASNLYVGLCI